MDFDRELREILLNDPLGLLNVKSRPPVVTADDRLIRSFEEINAFYELNKKEPNEHKSMLERKLFSRLKHIREDFQKSESLFPFDRHGLLVNAQKIETVEDILDADPLGLLSVADDEDIFNKKFIKGSSDRDRADFIAQRKACKNFKDYEALFSEIHKDLSSGVRKLLPYSEKQLEPGNFFVQSGMILFLESVESLEKDKFGKHDGRTKIIFENGTESRMLFRSLGKILLEDGKAISAPVSIDFEINSDDVESGFIYILKSLHPDPRIANYQNLHKIGFSRQPVEVRIKNSSIDPTYLLGDVEVLAEFKTFNVNPHKLESLIHTFFSDVQLSLKLRNDKGQVYKPQEWYVAPLDCIIRAVELIISGEIINYRYDSLNEKLVIR